LCRNLAEKEQRRNALRASLTTTIGEEYIIAERRRRGAIVREHIKKTPKKGYRQGNDPRKKKLGGLYHGGQSARAQRYLHEERDRDCQQQKIAGVAKKTDTKGAFGPGIEWDSSSKVFRMELGRPACK